MPLPSSNDAFEARLPELLRQVTHTAAVGRRPARIAADAMESRATSLPKWVAFGAVSVIVVAVAFALTRPAPSRLGAGVAAATVNGVEYRISTASGYSFPAAAQLKAVGTIEATNYGEQLRGREAYALPNVKDAAILVVPVDGALRADFPQAGDYVLLLMPDVSTKGLCQYAADAARAAADGCP